ncbi:hypothetical protein [Bacillus altitudinis]
MNRCITFKHRDDHKIIPIEEALEYLTNEEEMVLIIDGSLL